MYSPDLQATIDAANAKNRACVRKQFVKKATDAQKLAAVLESCSAVLDAYYAPVNDPEHDRKLSLSIRVLRSTVVDVRPGVSSVKQSVVSGRA